ncbi:MAG: hypothetical protein A3I14_00755 [Candidatus Rokubacteria bacterium RIFCSPLOWO2_02_FULL_73_56]|nr:MAG: hypothetical protein A3D33_01740 [Candidatus Rokubacteria bacterium RIFCSPHIGHO2_02_FULL_73_26]OGL11260.1 MAG: hypothetical protein A3I14_00755 [Candidatus Rokubacteria bacterium RIFCSPLOWO2_02_FULL_73_56]OGL29346.1 MAG: hypothetical protein A3G44_12680 [Candidatus Rokubacteria bacterium RIFCSPLOWO2_12_FULL_73_47]
MEWLGTILTGLALLVLLAPLLSLLVTVFVLVPLAHLLPHPAMVARASFTCPFSKRRVSAAFLTSPGSQAPSDVLSCSLFGDGGVRCKKGCLGLAESLWEGRPVVARYALLADGEASRL